MLKTQGRADSLKNLIYFDTNVDDTIKQNAKKAGIDIHYIGDVIEAGRQMRQTGIPITFEEPSQDSIAMFCYTSGTTGDPKAAMLTHLNMLSSATAAKYAGFDVNRDDCYISYLPMAHVLEKVLFVMSVVVGSQVGFYAGDVLKLTDDC